MLFLRGVTSKPVGRRALYLLLDLPGPLLTLAHAGGRAEAWPGAACPQWMELVVLEAGSPAPVPVPQASGPPAPLGWASRIAENAGSSGVHPNLQARFWLLLVGAWNLAESRGRVEGGGACGREHVSPREQGEMGELGEPRLVTAGPAPGLTAM